MSISVHPAPSLERIPLKFQPADYQLQLTARLGLIINQEETQRSFKAMEFIAILFVNSWTTKRASFVIAYSMQLRLQSNAPCTKRTQQIN